MSCPHFVFLPQKQGFMISQCKSTGHTFRKSSLGLALLEQTTRQVNFGAESTQMDWMSDARVKAADLDEFLQDSSFKSILHEALIRKSFQLLHYERDLVNAETLKNRLIDYLRY